MPTRHFASLALLALIGIVATELPCAVAAEQQTVLRNAQASVVKLFGAGGLSGLEAYGTGVLVSADGHIATVNSTILDEGEVTVVMIDGARYSGLLVAADPIAEIALLKIEPAGEVLPYFDLSAAGAAESGQPVWALANLFGIATGDEPVSVLQGVVASVTPLRAQRRTTATDRGESLLLDMVTSNPGAAGGAVIDRRGRLLGLVGRELRAETTAAWVSHAMPAGRLAKVVDRLLAGSPSPAATVAERPPVDLLKTWGFALAADIALRTPPFVDYIRPASGADTAGLLADDLVVMVGGRVCATCREVERTVARATVSQPLRLTVQRNEELVDIQVIAQPNVSPANRLPRRN